MSDVRRLQRIATPVVEYYRVAEEHVDAFRAAGWLPVGGHLHSGGETAVLMMRPVQVDMAHGGEE